MENAFTPPENTLYQYRPPKGWAYENLCQRVLYLGPPADFNDPYDCFLPPALRHLSRDEKVAYLRKHMPSAGGLTDNGLININASAAEKHAAEFRQNLGVACFSERNDNLLMWSHYADGGKGFCLAFDTRGAPFFNKNFGVTIHKVKYSSALPAGPGGRISYVNFLMHKSEDWKYEEEWRYIKRYDNGLEDADRYVGYAGKVLKAVYFGTNATNDTKALVHHIVKGVYPHAKMWQGELDNTEYKVNFKELYL